MTFSFYQSGLGTSTTGFDEPKDPNNAPLGTIPWGKMNFQIESSDGVSIGFTIDLRDYDWSQNTSKYSAHDTYINIDFQSGFAFLSKALPADVYDSSKHQMLGNLVQIWSFWSPGSNPSQLPFKVPITLFNKIENTDESFGFLSSGSSNIYSGNEGYFAHDATATVSVGTVDTNYNNERYYSFKWSNSSEITPATNQNIYESDFNFSTTIEKFDKSITRNFRTVYPLTVNLNSPEGNSAISGDAQFKDPTTTNNYVQINVTTSGYVKNEAFYNLNETINSQPNQQYGIKANSVVTYNNKVYYWYSGDFNTSGTDIVITGPTTKTANYKGHLISNSQSATSLGSQRKIAKDYNGTLHMVYVSLDKVWYTYSTDGGSTWSAEERISGSGSASEPCIAASGGSVNNDVYFVWQETSGSTNYLYIRSLNTITTPTILDSDASSVTLQPSIAVSSDENKVLVLYKKMNSGNYQIHYKYSTNYGSTFSTGGALSIGTPIIRDYPSIAWNPQSIKFMVSTSYASGSLSIELLSFNGSTWTDEGNVYYSTQVPSSTPYSQVAVDGTGRTHITWIAYDNLYGTGSAAMHRSMLSGSWSTISLFRDDVIYEPSIVYTSVCGHNDGNGGASIFYAAGSSQVLYDIYSTDNSSWNGINYISPSSTIYRPEALEKAAPQSVSYVAVKGTSLPYEVKSQTKNNSQSGTYYGTLKIASNNETSGTGRRNIKLYRRMEIIDTVNGGMLTVQFGNISGKTVSFTDDNNASDKKLKSSFMSTSPFIFDRNDSLLAEYGVNSRGWKDDAKLILDLIDPSNGSVIRNIGEYDIDPSISTSFNENKLNKIMNWLQKTTTDLSVRIEGLDY